jgi:hypothetical protein
MLLLQSQETRAKKGARSASQVMHVMNNIVQHPVSTLVASFYQQDSYNSTTGTEKV